MTPTVHFDNDVTLKIKIEVTSHSGDVTISGVTEPILSQRVVDQVIRLREGEANILGGIDNKQDQTSWTGIPGLSSIPILKYIFGSKDRTVQDDDIVFVVVPHVVRAQSLDSVNLRTIDTGVGQTIELRHLPADLPGGSPTPSVAPASPARPVGVPRAGLGPLPGQSAEAAAPAAMAQMRDAASMNPAVVGSHLPLPVPPAGPDSGLSFALTPPPGPVAAGTTFVVPVMLNGGTDVASVPLQLHYDADKISLVNVAIGNYMGRDGQASTLLHRDDPPGNLTVNTVRPPGTTGMSGSGTVYVLSFEAKAAGDATLAITGSAVTNSAKQQIPAKAAQVNIQVR